MNQSHLSYALLVIPILVWQLFATNALGQWSTDPNVNNAISTAANDQLNPTIVSDGAAGAIITWYDQRSGNLDIYAQRINNTGVVQWTPHGVAISTAANDQSNPTIVSDGAGGANIAWHDQPSGIYAQRINASGAVQWTANGVAISTSANDINHPKIVSDGAGGAIITWTHQGTNLDIYAQRINASGAVQWTANGVAISTAAGHQDDPAITSDGAGGAIITWNDQRSGNFDIYARRINSSGVVQWTANGVAISTAANYQYLGAITSDGAGGAIITWEDGRVATNSDIYAQRINASGAVQWTADGAAISTALGNQFFPTIVSDGAGGAIITWTDPRNGNNDIYAQRINPSGVVQWTAIGVAISTATNAQEDPDIVSDGAGGAVITWRDRRSFYDIYAQRINASGVVQWITDGVAISIALNAQDSPAITSDSAGGAIITWNDYRNGNSDIYAQLVCGSGNLGCITAVIERSALPSAFRLHQNYPNPFNPTTRISFSLPLKSVVSLKVFDALGRQVSILLSEELPAGTYSTQWDAAGLPSGVYFYRLVANAIPSGQAGSFIQTRKFVLLR